MDPETVILSVIQDQDGAYGKANGIAYRLGYVFAMSRTICILLLSLFALAGCATPRPRAPQQIEIQILQRTEGSCTLSVNTNTVFVEELPQSLADVPRDTTIVLRGGVDTRYGCIGGLIYTLQYLGFKEIGFVSESASTPP